MIVVGLTGNVGAGKSTVARLWRRAGVPVVSADRLARTAVAPGSPALAQIEKLFGPGVIGSDGFMDRAHVRRRVFRDPETRKQLEAIVHPVVKRLRDEWTEERRAGGADLVVWEIPLLFETGAEDEVDVIVLVDAPPGLRRRRIMETRGLTAEAASAIMNAQLPTEVMHHRTDFVVENAGTREELDLRAAHILDALVRGAANASHPPPRSAEGGHHPTGREG